MERKVIRIMGPSSLSSTWNAFSKLSDSSSKTSEVSGIQWWANKHWCFDNIESSGQKPEIFQFIVVTNTLANIISRFKQPFLATGGAKAALEPFFLPRSFLNLSWFLKVSLAFLQAPYGFLKFLYRFYTANANSQITAKLRYLSSISNYTVGHMFSPA